MKTLKVFVYSLLFFLFLFITTFSYNKGVGNSMLPTLHNNKVIFVNNAAYNFGINFGSFYIPFFRTGVPDYNDIVSFQAFNKKTKKKVYLVKRVVGLPGDSVKIENYMFYLKRKGSNLWEKEPFVKFTKHDFNNLGKPYQIKEVKPFVISKGDVYLLGDNREISFDSRHMGTIHIKNLTGKILFEI